MRSDGTSDPDDSAADAAAEQFAALLAGGDDPAEDDELAHEVALARRLGALGSSLDPEPQARERARQRLLAALAREARTGGDDPASDGPSRAS